MKPKPENSESGWDALFKMVNHPTCPPDDHILSKLREQSVAAFEAAAPDARAYKASDQRSETRWRAFMKPKIIRLSVAAAVLAAALTTIHFLGGNVETTAFAQVVKQLSMAHTLIYTMITPGTGDSGPIETECIYKEPGHIRATSAEGIVTVMDGSKGKGLSIVHPMQMYMELSVQGMPDNPSNDPLESVARLRELPASADEILDAREINGQWADGYRVNGHDLITTVWIGQDHRNLVRVEQDYPFTPNMNVVLTDFEFDLDVDNTLFDLAAPDGYTLKSYTADGADLDEQDFIQFMRTWSSMVKDRTFPPTVNGLQIAQLSLAMGEQGKFEADWTAEQQEVFGQAVYKGIWFVNKLSEANHWRYAGADVTYGDTETPIFWYRPQGSSVYRVIYGDLSVKNLLPEELP